MGYWNLAISIVVGFGDFDTNQKSLFCFLCALFLITITRTIFSILSAGLIKNCWIEVQVWLCTVHSMHFLLPPHSHSRRSHKKTRHAWRLSEPCCQTQRSRKWNQLWWGVFLSQSESETTLICLTWPLQFEKHHLLNKQMKAVNSREATKSFKNWRSKLLWIICRRFDL